MHTSIAYFPGAVLGPTAKPRGPKCARFPKFARRLKWVCPNRKWPYSRKKGRGTIKREAPISARPVAFAASDTWLIRR